MKRSYSLLLALLTVWMAMFVVSPASAKLVLDKDYKLVEPAQPQPATVKGVEVLEFFNYACSHCYDFQPHLKTWLKNKPKNADFRYVHAVFNEGMIPLAKIHYALEEMKLLDTYHDKVYDAIHAKQLNLADRAILMKWVGDQGIDAKKFEATFDSFSVNNKVQRAAKMTRDYRIGGTPYLVVGGRYLLGQSAAIGPNGSLDDNRFNQILNELIDMSASGAK
jgi:protein dithiol oxidoreductase (disulfide-forming)